VNRIVLLFSSMLYDDKNNQHHAHRISYLLIAGAVINFAAFAVLLFRATHQFTEPLSMTGGNANVIAVLVGGAMLLAANAVYQLVLQWSMPFSTRMAIGFVGAECLYSVFMMMHT
jgi:hypothetical protein